MKVMKGTETMTIQDQISQLRFRRMSIQCSADILTDANWTELAEIDAEIAKLTARCVTLMHAHRIIEGRIEAIEFALHEQPHVTPSRDTRRKYHAYRLQFKAVLAQLGGHPTIADWSEYNAARRAVRGAS